MKDCYFYGTSIRDVPLGSKGVIDGSCGDHYKIKIGEMVLCLRMGNMV